MNLGFFADALAQIYIACCLQCRHLAVRIRPDGSAVCDWCLIAIYEARQRIFLARLFGDG